jgi:small subunit ribosomal protein S6
MRQYETAFLIAPNLPEEDNEKLISQMADVVSKQKGKMINVDEWGKRKLAYPIQKFEEAYYVFFLYEGDPAIPVELERRFKQTEPIIRYMTVKSELAEGAKKRGRAPTKRKRDVVGVKEEKDLEKKDVRAEKVEDDLEKEPKEEAVEKPAKELTEEPKIARKPEPEEAPKKEAEVEKEKKPKAKVKEEPRALPKAEGEETKDLDSESEPGEKRKKEAKDAPKAEGKTESGGEPKADAKKEAKDKTKEKPKEKVPPEDTEKKEK